MSRFKTMLRGRSKPGVMNKTEAVYEGLLRIRQIEGAVLWYAYEAITFKLAKDTRYTPDFVVMLQDGSFECHEVKGFWRDDAKVKIKVAAAMFPIKFIAVKALPKKAGGGWEIEEF